MSASVLVQRKRGYCLTNLKAYAGFALEKSLTVSSDYIAMYPLAHGC